MFLFRLHRWHEQYRKLAKRYKAHLRTRFFLPRLTMSYGGQRCEVLNFHRSFFWRRPATRIYLAWPDASDELEIYHFKFGSRLWTQRGFKRVDTSSFTASRPVATWIKTERNESDFLSVGAVQRFQALLNGLGPTPFNLLIRRGVASLTYADFIVDENRLKDVLELTWLFLDHLRYATPDGVAFAQDLPYLQVAEARCPVCSQTISGRIAVCVRCQTPHCQEEKSKGSGLIVFGFGIKVDAGSTSGTQ